MNYLKRISKTQGLGLLKGEDVRVADLERATLIPRD